MDKPIWEGHEYNSYKQDPKHYENAETEAERIRSLHEQNEIKKAERKQINEWAALSVGATGGPNIKGQNHGLTNDRFGLVVDHLGDVSKNIKRESVKQFVQDTNGWMKRFRDVS
tara:strand:- start:38 stop:379 length:342 start_codon:yes stop_codon:yes gene_type:complete